MQTKKDEVREKIIESGLQNFLELGYKGSSIRKISKDAGTTLGNFYNYFENKLALFNELVKYEHKAFIDFIGQHNDSEEAVDLESMDTETLMYILKDFAENLMPSFTDRFLLLLARSEGTPYENARNQFEDIIKSHYLEHLKEIGNMPYDEVFANLLSHQFIDSMIYILELRVDESEKKRLMAKMFLYMFLGIASIMDKFPGI